MELTTAVREEIDAEIQPARREAVPTEMNHIEKRPPLNCPVCGFRIFTRRHPKCESCGALLPEALVYSASEIATLREGEEWEENNRQAKKNVPIKRPRRFVTHCAIWFMLVGPIIIALPLLPISPAIYLFGAIPAFLAGYAFGLLFRSRSIPSSRMGRARIGATIGAISTFICLIVFYLLNSKDISIEHFFERLEVTTLVGMPIIGALAGAFAAAVMPEAIRCMGELQE